LTTLTLLAKIYNSHQLRELEGTLTELFEDLNVEAVMKGTAAGKWVQLEVSGEDEPVATKMLEREAGFCPVDLANVKKFSTHKGYIVGLNKAKEELQLDIGVYEPKTVYASVPLTHLQDKVAGGKKVPLKKLAETWGLCDNMPLNLKVLEVDAEAGKVKAELVAGQIKKFADWKDSLLDRLIVVGASKRELNEAVDQEGLGRDVINVEALGMFEYAMVCKLGTDAAGLIGRLGRRLRKAQFSVFNPKKIDV
jgi:hypothetical protein